MEQIIPEPKPKAKTSKCWSRSLSQNNSCLELEPEIWVPASKPRLEPKLRFNK